MMNNRELCEKYPFLILRNFYTQDSFGYEYTWLDDMPDGWRVAFGEQMCEEIAQALKKADCLDGYSILQIKEKYGRLRWYDSGGTEETDRIIDKYSDISAKTCIICGKKTTYFCNSPYDFLPICDECKAR